jgi:hypothetical protein
MAIALVTHAGAAGANGATTAAIDTTGATLLIAVIAEATGGGATLSDSKSNTWTQLTLWNGSTPDVTIYYVANPTVGTNHTFTISGASSFSVINASSFSGVATTTPFDVENGLSGGGFDGTNGKPGSTTPTQDNELLIYGTAYSDATSRTVDSGFTILDQTPFTGGTNYGGGASYLIQTTAGAVNPLWNINGAGAVGIATFKAAAASSTGGALAGGKVAGGFLAGGRLAH